MILTRKKKYIVFMAALLGVGLLIILLEYNGIIGSPPQMPEIVFVCTKYDLQDEVCEIKFIDKDGECYYSNDPYVCKDLHGIGNKINAYRAGKIDDRIELYNSCSKNEVIRRYRIMDRIFKKGDLRMIDPQPGRLTTGQSSIDWYWYWVYFDESGEIQYIKIHQKEGKYEEKTNNRQVNQIYKWCKNIMGEMKD